MNVSLVPTVASDVQVVLPGDITAGLVANQIADSTAHARHITLYIERQRPQIPRDGKW